MLTGALGLPRVDVHVTPDDFRSTLKMFGTGFFDVVLCHGGLHHVVDVQGPQIESEKSAQRQLATVERLAKLTRPGGIIILADIPDGTPEELPGPIWDQPVEIDTLKHYLGKDGANTIAALLELDGRSATTLRAAQTAVRSKLVKDVRYPVPRHFFDAFVASKTAMGHTASYVHFGSIHERIISDGFSLLGRINYRGPWLFKTTREAGWFFREKFSVGEASALGAEPAAEEAMFHTVEAMLGTRSFPGGVAVNWGVTYAIYQRKQPTDEKL
jgi:SAM-dependent methyltransferase